MSNQHPPSWVLIFVAIIGALGVILAAVLSQPRIAPMTQLNSNAIATNSMTPTEPSVLSTNTPLPIVSIPTIATEIPIPTATNISFTPIPLTLTLDTKVGCVHPEELAKQKGWTNMGWADEQFGGLRVEVSRVDELPGLWEAIGIRRINQSDTDRQMIVGVWSIYPPFSCRAQLGFN